MNHDHERPEQLRTAGRDGPLHAASNATVEVPLPPGNDPDAKVARVDSPRSQFSQTSRQIADIDG